MGFFELGWLAAWVCAVQGEVAPVVNASSSNGLFQAEIRKAQGQERVPDAIARWRVSVFEVPRSAAGEALWSSSIQHRAGDRSYFLADDGRAFVALEHEYSEARALVRIWGAADTLFELASADLDVERTELEASGARAWLADGDAAPRLEWSASPVGPAMALRLTTTYGATRYVDLASGAVAALPGSITIPYVEPPASRVEKPGLKVPITRRFSAPETCFWNDVLEVSVSGEHSTPNWMFVGFELHLRGSGEAPELWLTPIAAPPPRNSVQAQVFQRFDATARVRGLMPGVYSLHVEGCEETEQKPLRLEVRPARGFLELTRRGGIVGFDQTVRVYPNSIAVESSVNPPRDPSYRYVPAATMQRLIDLAAQLRTSSRAPRDPHLADGFEFRLAIWDGVKAREFEFHDPGAVGALLEVTRLLYP